MPSPCRCSVRCPATAHADTSCAYVASCGCCSCEWDGVCSWYGAVSTASASGVAQYCGHFNCLFTRGIVAEVLAVWNAATSVSHLLCVPLPHTVMCVFLLTACVLETARLVLLTCKSLSTHVFCATLSSYVVAVLGYCIRPDL